MIEIPFSNGKSYHLKNKWEELTPGEFKAVLSYVMEMMNEEITLHQLRLKVLFLLSGLKPRVQRNLEKSDQQAENFYRMASQMNFMVRFEYKNTTAFSRLNKGIREKLERYLPNELDHTPEVRWADRAVKSIKPDLVFAKNLIPTIGRHRHVFKGYTFEVNDKILMTSLTTSQFIDAQTICTEIEHSGSESLLNLLVAILYSNPYDPMNAAMMREKLAWLDLQTKKAIYINFNAIQTYLCTRTKYSILFNTQSSTPGAKRSKHNLGLGSIAYSLIKAGYSNVENSNLVKFFEIMYSDLVSTVVSLHTQGRTIDKIAEQTGLTISKINQIL